MLPVNLRASLRTRSPVRLNPNFTGASGSWAMVNFAGEEKEAMRGLNERLKDYLDQVKMLEEANNKLESKIAQVLNRRCIVGDRDWSGYYKTISGLRQQFQAMAMENTHIMLQIDNARLATEDFKVKLESESVIRHVVELDIASLRKVIDDTHLSRMHLESQIESLREEIIYLNKAHEEDVNELKMQIRSSGVDVQMEANMGVDLNETIDTIRQQYERAVLKNQFEAENWYKVKFDSVSAEVSRTTDELEQGKMELNEMHRQKQGLEIDLQTVHSMILSLEETLQETSGRYAVEMNSHNVVLQRLEAELGEVHAHVTRQRAEYQALLNIKYKLEEEIATYRRLLEGIGTANFDIRDTGFRQDEDLRRFVSVQDPPSLPKIADVIDGDASAGNADESVEFSLDQALYANPPSSTTEQSVVMNETLEQEMNATNTAMTLQCNHEVACSHQKACPVIMGFEPPEMIPLVCPLFKEYKEEMDANTFEEHRDTAQAEIIESKEVDEVVQSAGVADGLMTVQDRVDVEVQLEEKLAECNGTAEESMVERSAVEEEEKSIFVCVALKKDKLVIEVQEEEKEVVAEEKIAVEEQEEGGKAMICAVVKREINPAMISLEFQEEVNTFVDFEVAAKEEAESIEAKEADELQVNNIVVIKVQEEVKSSVVVDEAMTIEGCDGAVKETEDMVSGRADEKVEETRTVVEKTTKVQQADEEQKNNIVVSIKVQNEVFIQEEAEAQGAADTVEDEKITKVQQKDEEQISKIVFSIKVEEEVPIQAGTHWAKDSTLPVDDGAHLTADFNKEQVEDDEIQMMRSSEVDDEEIKVMESTINGQEGGIKKADEEQINNVVFSIMVEQVVDTQEEAQGHGTAGTVGEEETMNVKEAGEKTAECSGVVEETGEVNGGVVEEALKIKAMETVEENCKEEIRAGGQEQTQSFAEWMGVDTLKNEEGQGN